MFGICLFSCRIEAPDKKAAFVWCLTLHLPHPVRLFGSLPRRRSFGSSRNPRQRTTFVGQEHVTNPKDRLRGSRGGGEGGAIFLEVHVGCESLEFRETFCKGTISDDWIRLSYDMKNAADRGGCCRPRWITPPEICRIFHSYPTKAEFNNCFIIPSK